MMKNILTFSLVLFSMAAWAVHPLDVAREKLAATIEGEVASATLALDALRAKALGCAPEATKVRVGTWDEVWPSGSGLVTNRVTGEVWNDAIQATLDAKGAVYVPARETPYYLDAPITLASGQAFVADPAAEFRLVPHVDLCLLRNKTVVGMDQQSLTIPNVAYDRGLYIEGGIWTSLLTTEKERNGNFWGRVSKVNPINGGYGAFVLNHVDGVVIRDVTFRQCNMHAIQISDVHRFRVDGVTFDRQGRDGVHVHGACDWGVIRRVAGDSKDDFVALNSWDWCHTSPTIGPIHHVLVEDSACVHAPNGDRPEGCGAIRIQPGNRKRPDGKGVCACPIDALVFRRLRNVREFKMYDQPNLERGRDVDRSEPIGTMREIYFDALTYDRPGVFEIADHLLGCDVSRVSYTYDARGEKLFRIHPKSGTWKHKPSDPATWVEIYSPDEDYTVSDFSVRAFTVRENGKDLPADAKSFVKVADGELNSDYPKTTPRGGTGKVTFAWRDEMVGAAEKKWMCPQMEMELYRVHGMRDDVRRMGLYAGHPGKLPMTRDNVFFRRVCAKEAPLPETWGAVRSTRYDEAEGRRYVEVRAGFSGCAAIRSAEAGWEAQVFDGSWRPVATYPDSPLPPHRERLPEDRAFAGLVATNGYYDAGEELLAYVECASESEPQLFAGESVPEMMDENRHHLEYDPTMVRVADDYWRTARPLALRYLRFATPVRNVKVVPVGLNRPVVGRLLTANARWAQMFDVGVRTLARCSDEFLIDGVKRDRLPWAGDLTVSLMADAYVYGDAEVARRSLSVMDAYEGDVNGIVTYSMWTIVSHDLYQLYFGDRQFLEDRWWRIKWRIENLISRTDADGFVSKGLDWVFVDWAKPESKTAMHMIWYGALEAAARLADRVGDGRAVEYRALAARVRASLNRRAWDEKRGLYAANPDDLTVFGRQANVYAVVFGVASPEQAKRIGDELAADRLPPVGTPYVYGWELVALNRTGHHRAFFDGLERVFGGMLDAGATTFWEGYDANEKGDDRYRFYGRPWGKSLCHVWSAWPAFVFVSEGLGVKPTSDGWRTWEQKPIPGAEGLRALVPTPRGVLSVGK